MLLSSVIIVLREVLEAALLFSILIALSKQMGLGIRWLGLSVFIGTCSAVAYGVNIEYVSEWFDGVGQEVTNALLQLIVYFMLVFYMLMLSSFSDKNKASGRLLKFFMIVITSLAMTREGSEIMLYFFSVTRHDNYFMATFIGMTIGASIGVSIGLLFYYLLRSLSSKKSIFIGLTLLLLVAAGMVSQASLLLIQADWLPAQLPLWNTSAYLSEKSVIGQLLYALIGYESTPTSIQVSLYILAYIFPVSLLIGLKFMTARTKKRQAEQSRLY